ncbi:MAG TPA: hypothetical protein VN040_17790 [Pseudosphingobacterium sp.]|nr:hypothetical protein [Pseudosphingobacterium sp.]
MTLLPKRTPTLLSPFATETVLRQITSRKSGRGETQPTESQEQMINARGGIYSVE